MSSEQGEGPEFGYGVDVRPLWSARDWAAEQVRVVLRAAGCAEFPAGAGFSVESHDLLVVGICDDFTRPARPPGRTQPGRPDAGYRTGPHPDDEELLAVWAPAAQTPVAPVRGERGRRCVEWGRLWHRWSRPLHGPPLARAMRRRSGPSA
ncbi:hypothetical protein [Actinomadura formosensis]|uniref:hypothetical protein n=1 Tax=Actinomadura formosensis TaxID=60706 RepID=UPI003D920A29